MKDREIEYKFTVHSMDLALTRRTIQDQDIFQGNVEGGQDNDFYWGLDPITQLRIRNGCLVELKRKDRGDNVDRLERMLWLVDGRGSRKFFTDMLGRDPDLYLQKVYFRWHLQRGMEISISMVTDDPKKRIFLEVEGPALSDVKSTSKKLQSMMELTREERSLWEIFRKA